MMLFGTLWIGIKDKSAFMRWAFFCWCEWMYQNSIWIRLLLFIIIVSRSFPVCLYWVKYFVWGWKNEGEDVFPFKYISWTLCYEMRESNGINVSGNSFEFYGNVGICLKVLCCILQYMKIIFKQLVLWSLKAPFIMHSMHNAPPCIYWCVCCTLT